MQRTFPPNSPCLQSNQLDPSPYGLCCLDRNIEARSSPIFTPEAPYLSVFLEERGLLNPSSRFALSFLSTGQKNVPRRVPRSLPRHGTTTSQAETGSACPSTFLPRMPLAKMYPTAAPDLPPRPPCPVLLFPTPGWILTAVVAWLCTPDRSPSLHTLFGQHVLRRAALRGGWPQSPFSPRRPGSAVPGFSSTANRSLLDPHLSLQSDSTYCAVVKVSPSTGCHFCARL